MKYLILIVLTIYFFPLSSQDDEGIRVIKDPKIDFLIESYKKENRNRESQVGYRIQVIFSNTREEVNKAKTKFYQTFPDMKCYIVYDQPYYKLQVGDFKTRLEAHKQLLDVHDMYPTAFIVNNEINVGN